MVSLVPRPHLHPAGTGIAQLSLVPILQYRSLVPKLLCTRVVKVERTRVFFSHEYYIVGEEPEQKRKLAESWQ